MTWTLATGCGPTGSSLEVELSEGSSHLNHAALRTTVDLLARGLAGPPGCQPGQAPADVCLMPSWDEANADVC